MLGGRKKKLKVPLARIMKNYYTIFFPPVLQKTFRKKIFRPKFIVLVSVCYAGLRINDKKKKKKERKKENTSAENRIFRRNFDGSKTNVEFSTSSLGLGALLRPKKCGRVLDYFMPK